MSGKVLTPESLAQICEELHETYPSCHELSKELDELLYMLFFVESDHFTENDIRNRAFLIRLLKKLVEERSS